VLGKKKEKNRGKLDWGIGIYPSQVRGYRETATGRKGKVQGVEKQSHWHMAMGLHREGQCGTSKKKGGQEREKGENVATE